MDTIASNNTPKHAKQYIGDSMSNSNGKNGNNASDVQLPNKRQKIAASSSSVPTESGRQQRKKRRICDRCHRPVPQTCLCDSLPDTPISLATTEVVVLQHPLELKNHKAASHRSLPLLELCLDPSSLFLRTGRRFGKDSLGDEILDKLWGKDTAATTTRTTTTSYLPVLVFPKIHVETSANDTEVRSSHYREDESTVLSLGELIERWKADATPNTTNKTKILLLVLDATWKHAREMHLANIRNDQYPPHMLRLALQPQDFQGGFVSGRFRLRGKASTTGYKQKQRNHEAAESVDESWMSTAECIAWILSNLESNVATKEDDSENRGKASLSLYEILMKPLDAMVAKWNSYRSGKSKGHNQRKNNNSKTSSLKEKCNDES